MATDTPRRPSAPVRDFLDDLRDLELVRSEGDVTREMVVARGVAEGYSAEEVEAHVDELLEDVAELRATRDADWKEFQGIMAKTANAGKPEEPPST